MLDRYFIEKNEIFSEYIMEEYDFLEEIDMIPVLRRRERARVAFTDTLSNEEFFSTTRFTKEGAQQLTARLEGQLQYRDERGLTPLNQVYILTL